MSNLWLYTKYTYWCGKLYLQLIISCKYIYIWNIYIVCMRWVETTMAMRCGWYWFRSFHAFWRFTQISFPWFFTQTYWHLRLMIWDFRSKVPLEPPPWSIPKKHTHTHTPQKVTFLGGSSKVSFSSLGSTPIYFSHGVFPAIWFWVFC